MTQKLFEFKEAEECDFYNIADFLKSEKYGLQKAEWIEWKYLKNPLGKGRVFVVGKSSGKISGMFGLVPCLIHSTEGKSILMMQAVDLFVKPGFRQQGIGRKILEEITNLISGPAIGFPNERAEAIMTKLGWRIVGSIERWYFPVKSDNFFVNGLLRLYNWLWLKNRKNSRLGLRIFTVTKFNNRFEGMLFNGFVGYSAEYLNWRYLENPLKKYSCFEFRDRGEQIGYCVIHIDGFQAEIYDFFVVRNARNCFQLVVDFCAFCGIKHLFFRSSGLRIMRYGFMKLRSKRKIISLNFQDQRLLLNLGCSDW